MSAVLRFATGGGYFYQIKKVKTRGRVSGDVSRISEAEFKKHERSVEKPSVGDYVEIIIKPYNAYNTEKGVVEQVLTKKKKHTRGHKVRLVSGRVGRTVKILR